MSIRLMSAAWELEIPSTEKMVLMCLCDHASDTGACWPSVATIARKTSKSERTVQAALRWLEREEYFTRDCRNGTSAIYRLDPRKICTPANFAPPQILHEPPQISHPTPAKSAPKPSLNHQEPSRDMSADADRLSVPEVVEGWNERLGPVGLPRVVKLTDSRKRQTQRMAKAYPVDDWIAVFAKVEQSPFLRGDNDRGWKADFDFVLNEKNFVKILEGKYDRQQAR
jgi:hypothetical protein